VREAEFDAGLTGNQGDKKISQMVGKARRGTELCDNKLWEQHCRDSERGQEVEEILQVPATHHEKVNGGRKGG
jgi:hypothetical protein